MSLSPRILAAGVSLAALAGCATTRSVAHRADDLAARESGAPVVRHSQDLLTAEEIATLPDGATALDALRLLRPRFLERHGSPSPDDMRGYPPIVYLNGQRVGLADALQTIPVAAIVDVRYLTPSAASLWYMPGHSGGVILVRTRR